MGEKSTVSQRGLSPVVGGILLVGILVLFIGLVLSMYGNVMRRRYERQLAEERRATTAADGGETSDD